MARTTITSPVAADAVDRLALGASDARDSASPMNMGLFSVGAQPACMADD
jgi:hypothetical protein